jgi:uncharacterized protein YggE
MRTLTGHMWIVVVVVACLWSPAWTWGRMALDGTISGNGIVVLKREPQVLRLQIDLLAKGKNLKEVLEKLKARREAARKQLTALVAAPASIEFADVKIMPGKTDQQRQMEMMIRQRMRSAGRATTKEAEKFGPLTVSVGLKAEWPLQAATAEERLLRAHELEEKLKAADLAGRNETEQLSPEEQEAAEESEDAQMRMYESSEGPKPGEPVFLYVGKIPDPDRAKALAEAFGKAKAEAARLAEAAGVTLGALRYVGSGSGGPWGTDYEDMSAYSNSAYARYLYPILQRARAGQGDVIDEAIGVNAGMVTMRYSVSAAFAIK